MSRIIWDFVCYAPGGEDDPPGNGGGGGDDKPAWAEEFGDEFKPDKAYDLIKTLRESERTLKRDLRAAKNPKPNTPANNEPNNNGGPTVETLNAENKKLQERLDEMERAATHRAIALQVSAEAGKQGAMYPDDVVRLIDAADFEVENGKVTNVAALIKELKSAKPGLFGKVPGADGPNGRNNGSPAGTNMNDLIRSAAGR